MSEFWKIIKHNWTIQQRAELRAYAQAWNAANHTPK